MAQAQPQNTAELFSRLLEKAYEFGFKNGTNGNLRDCIHSSKDKEDKDAKLTASSDNNFWFGFVREDQGQSGGYEGLSFVIMPEMNGTNCVVSLCLGSQSINTDSELAASPFLRRSYTKLTKKRQDTKADFFFKLRFDEMEEETPGLKAFMEKNSYDKYMQATTELYNSGDHHGKLPAAMVVDYATPGGYELIVAWLAQYAEWRNWSSFKNGNMKAGQREKIQEAINTCKVSDSCMDPKSIKEILLARQFIVLQGAPGCGKTYSARQLANEPEFRGRCEFTQFHAETSYSDFIYGIKPVLDGHTVAYQAEKGILLKVLDNALKDEPSGKKHLLIIDEFNRANLANVLGPVFYLFEQKKDDSTNLKLSLGHYVDQETKQRKEIVYDHIPSNLYVIATMNTADKSLAVVDFALRRRFSWITLRPHAITDLENFDSDLFEEVDNLFTKYATDEELNLQPGQSYFLDRGKRKENILYGLMPLMKEYFTWGYLNAAKEEFAQLFYRETGTLMFE